MGQRDCYVTRHPGQLSLAIPSWAGVMSTRQRAVTPCGCGKVGHGSYVGNRQNCVIPLLHTGDI